MTGNIGNRGAIVWTDRGLSKQLRLFPFTLPLGQLWKSKEAIHRGSSPEKDTSMFGASFWVKSGREHTGSHGDFSSRLVKPRLQMDVEPSKIYDAPLIFV